ncbi:MAG: response regulator [Pseudomonadota bacterium]
MADVTIYLVDDDRGMVSATSQWLSLSGLKVRAFADPAALIKVLKPGQPCVVISDIRMPGIDGMELLKLVKARDKRIPVILITGHGDIPLAVEAMKLGAHEFLAKPFSPERLLDVTRDAQSVWEMEDELAEGLSDKKEDTIHFQKEELATSALNPNSNLSDQVEEFEKELIESSLKKHQGAIPKVIDELDIPRRTLNAKMKKYGIVRAEFK